MPVAVTTIVAVPRVTDVFWKSMFVRSPSPTSPSGERARVLGHRGALPGQRRLLRLQGRRPQDAPVGGDDVTGLELHDVTGDDVDRGDQDDAAVAQDLRLRDLQVRQGVDAGPGLELLTGAEHDVQHDQQRRR